MTRDEFAKWTESGIRLMDGATGTNLIAAGMSQSGGAPEMWMLEHADLVKKIQGDYVEAGSDIIYACTFSANRESLRKYGLADRTEEINIRLVEITKDAVKGQAFVAGDLTMTGELLEPLGDMEEDELLDIYREQVSALVKGGVDLLGVETMLSQQETVIAVRAAKEVCNLPVICTMTTGANGMTLYGCNVVEAAAVLEAEGASAVGVNCSPGPDQLEDVIRRIKEKVSIPVIAKPNAGLPSVNGDGKIVYSLRSDAFAENMRRLVEAGATIIGGCCGTTPLYIRKLKEMIREAEM